MSKTLKSCLLVSCLAVSLGAAGGCTHYQVTKDIWKDTKGLWAEYLSPPASIDYDDTGSLSEKDELLAQAMMNVDIHLGSLERTMLNADRPPTKGWMQALFTDYPWIDGFSGIKAGGEVLGSEVAPGKSAKTIDFNPVLYEDSKQAIRALRCDVQQTSDGPEVIVAAPLYDGIDFLGVVATYFDPRDLMKFSPMAQETVLLTPLGLLWPGKYDFAATPLAGVDWQNLTAHESTGTLSNANGTFAYQVRWFGNLPMVFAVAVNGSFPAGNGSPNQGLAFFPKREKVAAPPVKPRTRKPVVEKPTPQQDEDAAQQAAQEEMVRQNEAALRAQQAAMMEQRRAMMEKQRAAMEQRRRQIQEQMKKRQELQRRILLSQPIEVPEEPAPQPEKFQAPSPFGPRSGAAKAAPAKESQKAPEAQEKQETTPVEKAAPAKQEQPAAQKENTSTSTPAPSGATLPGGRPSPFGPR